MTQYERIARLEVALTIRDQRQRRLALAATLLLATGGIALAAFLSM